ncbi:MAG: outer membrane beta-barrel protein [Chlamydiota bacterium]|nr:outer membrane beta-barrel protein [Chlamydiota bacterium]
MKRYISIFFILGLLLTEPCKAEFGGVYFGQSFGNAHNKANFSSETNSVAVFGLPHTMTISSQPKNDNESFWGEIYGGYGCTYFSHLYVGLRVGANLSYFDVKNRNSSSLSQALTQDISISSTITNHPEVKLWLPEATFDQKIGWVFCQKTLVFGLVGFAVNRPSLKGSVVASDSGSGDTPFDGEVNFSLRKKGQYIHFRCGVGLEYQFLCNWGLQFLYTHTNYGKLSYKGVDTYTDNSSVSLTASTSIKTKINKEVYSVGFVHYF